MKDTQFYNKESTRYSGKRYPARASFYVQSFYLRRLQLTIELIRNAMQGSGRSLLEIGCADGVVVSALYDAFPHTFSSFSGVDISPQLVEAARSRAGGRNISFGLRDTYTFAPKYDLVVEVGVINYADEKAELESAKKLVADDGYYLCSIAGTSSLWHCLKPHEDKGFNNFLPYAEYENAIRERFEIVKVVPVGLFIPHIWKVPVLARIIQPLCESIFALVFPNLFHEKLYLLSPRA